MDIKELTKVLGSSITSSRYKYIPWWDGDFDEDRYRYNLFSAQEIQDAEACIAECGKEELEDTSGNWGMSLFHLLVWHNFYDGVKKILEEGRADANLADGKGKGLTPFLLACCRGNLAMAKLLLEHGAEI